MYNFSSAKPSFVQHWHNILYIAEIGWSRRPYKLRNDNDIRA